MSIIFSNLPETQTDQCKMVSMVILIDVLPKFNGFCCTCTNLGEVRQSLYRLRMNQYCAKLHINIQAKIIATHEWKEWTSYTITRHCSDVLKYEYDGNCHRFTMALRRPPHGRSTAVLPKWDGEGTGSHAYVTSKEERWQQWKARQIFRYYHARWKDGVFYRL